MASNVSTREDAILAFVEEHSEIKDSLAWSKERSLAEDEIVSVLQRLAVLEYLTLAAVKSSVLRPTEEGAAVAEMGSPEARVFRFVSDKATGVSKDDVKAALGDIADLGIQNAMKLKWISFKKPELVFLPNAASAAEVAQDPTQAALKQLVAGDDSIDAKLKAELKRRRLAFDVASTTFKVGKGAKFSPHFVRETTALTSEMIISGEWQKLRFKSYNFASLGVPPMGGTRHPLMKVRASFRQIFLELGFEEMPTNHFVESSFWNFDSLFQPQQHPARDAHDTFFLKSPSECREIPADYLERVRAMHTHGGNGSIGWRYEWKEAEARKNVLRTHTTAVSSRMLYALAQREGGFEPKKYFSIDRVYRNEALDATHLAEFHQVEGLVADYNLTLGDLMGYIQTFFTKMGIKKLRFKPAYNPYTEPSMEVFSYHEGLQKWIEVGNSGMFRPEMLLPMGLPPDVRVIAFGLSLERPAMAGLKINNIRELFGHKMDLNFARSNPIVRLEKW